MYIEKGDIVIIQSLAVTRPRHGLSPEMEKMLDGEYEVRSTSVEFDSVKTVYISDDNGTSWTFAPEDLKVINPLDYTSISMTSELIMFDPNELI